MANALVCVDRIHSEALEISTRYKKAEADLVEVLQRVEEERVFLRRGHASLFAYVVGELGLSESVSYGLITVARKAREVPELKAQLQSGEMTFSNARRVVAVLTPANKDEWIKKACELTNRELEKELVRVSPREATVERASYVTPERMKLELGLSESAMRKLRRVQDLLCQSQRRPVGLEETIEAMTGEFLRRNDPVEKAQRHRARNGQTKMERTEGQIEETSKESLRSEPTRVRQPRKSGFQEIERPTEPVKTLVTRREPLRAAVEHQVQLRDGGQCVQILLNGSRCTQRRWLHTHHKIPVSEGGTNQLENLITLCSAHHRLRHL